MKKHYQLLATNYGRNYHDKTTPPTPHKDDIIEDLFDQLIKDHIDSKQARALAENLPVDAALVIPQGDGGYTRYEITTVTQ